MYKVLNKPYKMVTNILKRVVARSQVSEQTTMFDTYSVKDGETPEMIAHRLYGDINLHWVVLLVSLGVLRLPWILIGLSFCFPFDSRWIPLECY